MGNDNSLELHEYEYSKASNWNSPQMRERAVHMILDRGKTIKETQEWFGMCPKSLKTYCTRRLETGHIYSTQEVTKKLNKRHKRPTTRHKITPFCETLIHTIIDLTPQITLEKIKEELFEY
eukprot:480275_1